MDTEGEKAKGVRTHQLERWWQGLPRDKGEDVEAGGQDSAWSQGSNGCLEGAFLYSQGN